jgi:type II secretory pathway pseudopilin PulG
MGARTESVRGFTLLEALLVIALLGALVGLAIPFYQSFQVTSQVDSATEELVATFRSAQARAMASEGLQPFGVHLEASRFVVFRGTTYVPSDPLNEVTTLPPRVSLLPAGPANFIFSATRGATGVAGSVAIRGSNKQRNVTINELGVVSAQ